MHCVLELDEVLLLASLADESFTLFEVFVLVLFSSFVFDCDDESDCVNEDNEL